MCSSDLEGAAAGSGGDFFVVQRNEPEAIADAVLEIVARRLPARWGLDPVADVQVLAPMHRGPLGTEALNERLREVLNPQGAPTAGGLRVGDKVLQTRNDYDLELFNGDTGRVLGRSARPPRVNLAECACRSARASSRSAPTAWSSCSWPMR